MGSLILTIWNHKQIPDIHIECWQYGQGATNMHKGVVSTYKIGLVLPSVAENQSKMYPIRYDLQFSFCWHDGGKVSSFKHWNNHTLLWNILLTSICSMFSVSYKPRARFSKRSYGYSYEAGSLKFGFLIYIHGIKTLQNQNRLFVMKALFWMLAKN